MATYDINGVIVADLSNTFADNMHLDYCFDEESNANYTVLRIFRQRTDGSKQYPFVYAPNGADKATLSTLAMNMSKGFFVAINAGTFYTDGTNAQKPRGILIQNGQLVQQGETEATTYYPLTIDGDGNMSYVKSGADGNTLINNGIISAVNGWAPCIIDYEDAIEVIPDAYNNQTNAQRQIIGQFGNGDYAIVTCEGRDYDHSDGWTMDEAKAICKKLGLKFAYNLDGGGSTETVLGKKQINAIYEGTYGRIVPTYIVFNGTDTFGVPN